MSYRKLVCILVLQVVPVACLFASPEGSQGRSIKDVYVSLKFEEERLVSAFQRIERATGFSFSYNATEVEDKVVHGSYEKQSLFNVLLDFSRQLNLKFRQYEDIINVKSRRQSERQSSVIVDQDGVFTVRGKVVDRRNNEPLPGVGIMVKNTTTGTVTDFDGNYSLEVPHENAVLVFTFIGFAGQEISVNGRATVNVFMEESAETLKEVVVVGYGEQDKVNLTGAVDVINVDKLINRQAPTVSQLLQGLSPGMNFSINNEGFQPGAEMGITIRGMGSINGGSPYILIDGFPGDLNSLNPQDIESVSVLKDAAASAIYGASAPYGVILITTKKGDHNEKLSVTYSNNVSLATPQRLPEMLDSYTFARVLNEGGKNLGGIQFSNATIDRIIAYQNQDWDFLDSDVGPFLHPGASARYGAFPEQTNWNTNVLNYANNDWWDIYYGNSVNQKHDVSIKGGSDRVSYFLSAGFLSQEGVLNYGNDTYRRVNLMGKINFAVTKWWSIGWEPRFSKTERRKPNHVNNSDYTTIFQDIGRSFPTTPLYDGFGNYNYESHIPKILNGKSSSTHPDFWNNFRTEFTPLKGWKVNADFAYNVNSRTRSNVQPYMYTYLVDNTEIINGTSIPNSIERIVDQNIYWTSNIYSSYAFSIREKHNLSFLVGAQFIKDRSYRVNGKKTDLIVDDVPSFETATGNTILSERISHNASQGYFSRVAYNYKDKYMLESNVRYDGSSRFRQGNRWGLFPSFSVGWNIDQENFWDFSEQYLSGIKIRGSWGQLGNHNIAPYSDLYLLNLNTNPLFWIFGYGENRPVGYTQSSAIVNQSLTWETVTTKNIGVNLSFFNRRLGIDMDVFERETTDMIGPTETKPGVLGASVPSSNNATLRTRGWELAVSWKQSLVNGLSYNVNVNLYDGRSVVTEYYNPTGTLSTWYEGKEAGEIWGYTVHDLFRTQEALDSYRSNVDLSHLGANWRTGDVKFEDTNGDGRVNNGKNTVDDHGDLSIIGNSQPRYQFGISAGAAYKGFDLSMLWSGVAKRDMYFSNQANLFWGFANGQRFNTGLTPENLDYFRDEPGTKYIGLHEGDANINIDAYFPRPYLNAAEQNKNLNNPNTRYLQNMAYIRLQNIQIGYTFAPVGLIEKLKLTRLRVYFSGENLFTISKMPRGIDPIAINGNLRAGEGAGRLTYGADRIYSAGLSLSF